MNTHSQTVAAVPRTAQTVSAAGAKPAGLKPDVVAALLAGARSASATTWSSDILKTGKAQEALVFRSMPVTRPGLRGEIHASPDSVVFTTYASPPKTFPLLTGAEATQLHAQLLATVAIKATTLTAGERGSVLLEAAKTAGWTARPKGSDRSGLPPSTLHRFFAKPLALDGVRLGTLVWQHSRSGMIEATNLHFETTGGVHLLELSPAQGKALKNALVGIRNPEESSFR